eukprot:15362305-Ditylum_brightwellii.AAC.1
MNVLSTLISGLGEGLATTEKVAHLAGATDPPPKGFWRSSTKGGAERKGQVSKQHAKQHAKPKRKPNMAVSNKDSNFCD